MVHHDAVSADAAPAAPPPRRTLPALTGLRIVAAAWVVLDHYRYVVPYPSGLQQVAASGEAAVCLFFVLSGVILTYTYYDWFTADCSRYRAFLRARVARIYPLYLLGLLLMTPITLATPHAPLSDLGQRSPATLVLSWLANLALLQAFIPRHIFHVWDAPTWSVSVEWAFYLLFPLIARYLLTRCNNLRRIIWLIGGVCACQLLSYVVVVALLQARLPYWDFRYDMDYFVYFSPLLRVWEFLLGCAVGLLVLHSHEVTGLLLRLQASRAQRDAALATVLGACCVVPLAVRGLLGDSAAVSGLRWYVLFTPLFGALVLLLALGPSVLSPLLTQPRMLVLGEASYALYVLHWLPVIPLSAHVAAGGSVGLLVPAVAVVLTASAALLCFRYLETPLRRRLRGPGPTVRVAGTAVAGGAWRTLTETHGG